MSRCQTSTDIYRDSLWHNDESMIAAWFLHVMRERGVKTVLDIGCGLCHASRYFRDESKAQGYSLTISAVDIDQEAVERAQGLCSGMTVSAMDAHHLEFPDASFDAIWSSHAIEHLWSPVDAVREWRRVLKPKGLACILAPASNEVVPGHLWDLAVPQRLAYLLYIGGFALPPGTKLLRQNYSLCAIVGRRAEEPHWTYIQTLPDSVASVQVEDIRQRIFLSTDIPSYYAGCPI